ncbi:MAG TPA: hypothetical protein VLV18_08350 [Terriglobales bacterium]|nr:hypothetical protein [Terriglobales bacterium]
MISERITGLTTITNFVNLWNQTVEWASAILVEDEIASSHPRRIPQLSQQVSRAYIPFNTNR